MVLLIIVGVLVVLLVPAAVIDLRARRRKVHYTVDGTAARDARRLGESEGNMRSNGQFRNMGGGTQF